jgi:hypothetical protein
MNEGNNDDHELSRTVSEIDASSMPTATPEREFQHRISAPPLTLQAGHNGQIKTSAPSAFSPPFNLSRIESNSTAASHHELIFNIIRKSNKKVTF